MAQGKLVRVTRGAVFDVAVDLRPDSKTFGQWHGVELSDQNHYAFYVPEGFAHGFSVLENDTVFAYKCTNYYNKESEGCLIWNDPQLAIDWKITAPLLSEKDKEGVAFKNFISPF